MADFIVYFIHFTCPVSISVSVPALALLWLFVDYYYESAVCFMQRLLFRSLRFFGSPPNPIPCPVTKFLLYFFVLFNCFCFLACNLMPRYYLAHFPAAAAPHRTLSLSRSILYLLPIVVAVVVVAPNWDYTDWNSLGFAAGVLVPELLPHPDDR